MRSVDVERKLTQDGKVLGSVVLARAAGILCEEHVECPMQPVLDTPVTARDAQESFGRYVLRHEIVPYERRIGSLAAPAPARGDAAHRNHAGEVVSCGQAGIA